MSSPASVLRDAFERHVWATMRLLDHLEALGPDVYSRSVPGTYGQMDETLTHLVDADTRYLDRLGDPNLPPYEPRGPQPIAVLRTEIEANEARWSEALDLLEREELRASLGSPAADPPIDPAETLLLLQALHHGDDHRAQVCSTLGALELEVPDLDVWAFWDERR